MYNQIATDDEETPIDEFARRLHAAGWSVGDTAAGGPWIVMRHNGEQSIWATAASQIAAWRACCFTGGS